MNENIERRLERVEEAVEGIEETLDALYLLAGKMQVDLQKLLAQFEPATFPGPVGIMVTVGTAPPRHR
jgi:hypothetical protein